MTIDARSLAWLTASGVAAAVGAGELDPQQVTVTLLERIERLDVRVHAYVHVDRAARAGAGRLGGVALGVKDTQPVKGMPWTYGTARWRDRVAQEDAMPVARLRAAGASILGKLNLPELAAAVGTVNELFPPTENPWRPGFTPGGSSGGSGAAVAAGLCTAATGDDMGGSIRIPAACCGCFGLRPTTGTVPDEIPDAARLSVRGPLARSAADLRLLYEVMSGRTAAVAAPGRRLRVGVVTATPLGAEKPCLEAVDRAAAALERLGHATIEVAWDAEPVLRSYQVVRPVTMGAQPGEPEEYGEGVREAIRLGRTIGGPAFYLALQEGLVAARALLAPLGDGCDLLLTPTLGLLPMPIPEVPRFLQESWERYVQFLLPVSYAGAPAVAVPAGPHEGLPTSVQLVARPGEDGTALDAAAELEGAGFEFRRPPGFD